MRLVFDENLPPALPRALASLIPNHTFEHVVDVVGRGAPDEAIFATLAADATSVLITLDRKQARTPHVLAALRRSKLTIVFLEPKWERFDTIKRGELLLRWWPMLEPALSAASRGSWFRLPVSGSVAPLRPVQQGRRSAAKQRTS